MIDEVKLSDVLGDFARTVITDFPIQGILDHLVRRIVEVLPITGAGVTLISADKEPEYVAASDASALVFEQLQSEVEEGPCLAAYESGEAVVVDDLATDDRFPLFAPKALAAGLAAVFTFPLRDDDVPIGALDLYRTTPGPLDPDDMDAAQTLADVTTAYLLNARARDEAIATSEAFHHSSLHDPLTGLPNRQLLEERLMHGAALAKRSHTKAAVLFVDLDRFKEVNDLHGHHVGDALLVGVAERLSGLVRDGDTLARVSGDEFVLFCEDIRSPDDVKGLAERIGASLISPFSIMGVTVSITASVGIAFAGAGEDITDQLVVRADLAMYQVKRGGGAGHQIYDVRDTVGGEAGDLLPSEWRDEESFAADLRAGMASGAISVAYQPIVDLTSQRVRKVEALARWDHPVRGAVSPATFISLAERHGLIDELGAWVLQTACAAGVEMHRSGIAIDMAVNVSTLQLHHPDVVACVADSLAGVGFDADRLWIEVTESVLLDDRTIGPLHHMHDLGVRIAIDDFGTGYASFKYLTRLPVDALKIDMSFVKGLGVNASDTAIVRSVIGLGRELGIEVVAEGVETESQRAQLLALNCRLGQGWLFSRALTLDEFIRTYRQPDELHPVTSSVDPNESLRLAALEACRILDTDHEAEFDGLTRLASQLMATPMALISLIDADRQWFKARIGVDVTETSRDVSFCSHAIEHPDEPFVISDTETDDRFSANPLVTGSPNIRAYAGIPIRSREGLALGTLCVLDTTPRTFDDDALALLSTLAEQAATLLDQRRRAAELHTLIQRLQVQHLEATGTPELVTDDAATVASVMAELTRTSPARNAAPSESVNVVRFGPLVIDLDARNLTCEGVAVELDRQQFDLIGFLATRPGHVFDSADLCRRVWQSSQTPEGLHRIVHAVRTLLEPDPSSPTLLCSVGTDGYRFGPAGEASSSHDQPVVETRTGSWSHIDGRLVAADDEMLSMLAASLDEVAGRDMFDFVAVSSQPSLRARLEMRAAGHEPGPQVMTMQAMDGHQFTTLVESTPTRTSSDEQGICVTFQEILDPTRLLRELVSGVLGEVSDSVIVTDTDLRVLSWNQAAQRLYGWSEQDVLGHGLDDVVRPHDHSDRCKTQSELELTGHSVRDIRQITRDGVTVLVRTSETLIRDESGEATGVILVNRAVASAPSSQHSERR